MQFRRITISQKTYYVGSGGRIRTADKLVTPYLDIPTKGGLYLRHILLNLGAPVSSLYGAPPPFGGSHGIALFDIKSNVGFHRYPGMFISKFLLGAAFFHYVILCGNLHITKRTYLIFVLFFSNSLLIPS